MIASLYFVLEICVTFLLYSIVSVPGCVMSGARENSRRGAVVESRVVHHGRDVHHRAKHDNLCQIKKKRDGVEVSTT